jgi:hypothetical protein
MRLPFRRTTEETHVEHQTVIKDLAVRARLTAP